MELWDLVARERIRNTLARYNWSGDAFRLTELALAFCEDGRLEIRSQAPVQGREAIAAFLGGAFGDPAAAGDEARRAARRAEAEASGVTRIVRHNLTNVRFLEVAPDHCHVASYFTVVTEIGLDQPPEPRRLRARGRRVADPARLRVHGLASARIDDGPRVIDHLSHLPSSAWPLPVRALVVGNI